VKEWDEFYYKEEKALVFNLEELYSREKQKEEDFKMN